MSLKKTLQEDTPISEVIISLLSPETILKESRGEITRPETKNHRTYKPVEGGLFCERIYGPDEDWKCQCGKYKGIRYKYTICDECGVEINERKVRRHRMGHINLAVPVVHLWYYKYSLNKISLLLDIPSKELDEIIEYSLYIVIQQGSEKLQSGDKELKKMTTLTKKEYDAVLEQLPLTNKGLSDEDPNKFIAKTGAVALEYLIDQLDLEELSGALRHQISTDTSKQRIAEALKRLQIVEAFKESQTRIGNHPKWMILRSILVISPEYRPLLSYNNTRLSMSDITRLYKRVMTCNIRVLRLIELKAPEMLLRNECRGLQEVVNALFDNSSKGTVVTGEAGQPLQSLSDNLKGKEGYFRKNLLGKRVDYSGRSVIVCGPELKLHECGLPKKMAIELFKYHIIERLLARGLVENVKDAKNLIERKDPVILDILQSVVKGHPVLLNRAPTLHRKSIQAFLPKLVEGQAIQLHPLTCTAFNADFDGDQMGVHIPLSQEAIAEALQIMLSSKNLLNPINGQPIVVPSKDIVLGLYYLTKGKTSTPTNPIQGEGMKFYDIEEVIIAVNNNKVSKHAHIKLLIETSKNDSTIQTQIIDTTAGRALFNQYVPEELGYINELLTKQKIEDIVLQAYKKTTEERTAQFLDDLKDLGFKYCYEGGLSISLDNIKIPSIKEKLIQQAHKAVDAIKENYLMGIITNKERYNQAIDIWTKVNIDLTQEVMHDLEKDKEGFNNIFMMMDSGARGSREQVRQLGGMRGLMVKPQKNINDPTGGIIDIPVLNNFKEGLDVSGYFISTHGSRKGLTDTSMKTADAGHAGRKFTNVAQNLIIKEHDCGTQRGLIVSTVYDNEGVVKSLREQIEGRVPVGDIKDPNTGVILAKNREQITSTQISKIEKAGIKSVRIRTVITCESQHSICVLCYGTDLSNNKMVQEGTAAGLIAAHALGERSAQLTLRTFHAGGSALSVTVEDRIKTSLEGIVHFENLKIATIEKNGIKVGVVLNKTGELQILDPKTKQEKTSYHIPYGAHLLVQKDQKVEKNQEICYWDSYNAVILAEASGKVNFNNIEEDVTYKKEYDEQTGYYDKIIIESKDKNKNPSIFITTKQKKFTYNIPVDAFLVVDEDEEVKAGQILAKIPRIVRKMQDITGGLPRVTELFEARNPSNAAVLAPIEGIVSYGKIKRGNHEIIITAKEGTQIKTLVPLSKHILVQDQEYVKNSTMLSDGVINIADILHIEGPEAVQKYIIDEIQTVYRMQGVRINNKHIEAIVRQMMQKVEVISSGDTSLIPKQLVHKQHFKKQNEAIHHKKIIIDIGGKQETQEDHDAPNCSICLEPISHDASKTPCNHHFHRICISKWLKNHSTCPNCRRRLTLQNIQRKANDQPQFKLGQLITQSDLTAENERLERNNLSPMLVRDAKPAIAKLKIQGITQAILSSESFLASAAFQETAKVLCAASVAGKVDKLQGIKENVIVGNLIPVGTGYEKYQNMLVTPKKEYDALLKTQENHN